MECGGAASEIPDSAIALRWLEKQDIPTRPGRTRPNSDIFGQSGDNTGTSVIIALDEAEVLAAKSRHPNYDYWVRITVGTIREEGLSVKWDPSEDADPRHAAIYNWPPRRAHCKKVAARLRDACDWDGTPPPVVPAEDASGP